tara:strand:+ start:125 stop:442 length:318 start_codon:yes stop_codon:yes gene_type:complete
MGLLVDYKGGLDVEDYHLKYHGDGNGFQVYSNCNNGVINDAEARVHKGVIELTMEAASMGVISLGHADRYMLSVEEAESLITHLNEAIVEASSHEYDIVQEHCKA